MGIQNFVGGKQQYITAYDPIVRKTVLFTVNYGIARSTVSNHSFPYNPR